MLLGAENLAVYMRTMKFSLMSGTVITFILGPVVDV